MAVNSKMTLDGHALRVNPNEVRWHFKMKTTDSKSLGGKVIQILGVHMTDLTVRGQFSPDRAEGDTESWQQELRFRQWIDDVSESVNPNAGGQTKPVRFTYPPRGWDFRVFVTSYSLTTISPEQVSPTWEISLFPFDNGARKVVRGIEDLYIQRLMEGVGWKQTAYNGPMTQASVDAMLGGQTPRDYMVEQYGAAASGEWVPE